MAYRPPGWLYKWAELLKLTLTAAVKQCYGQALDNYLCLSFNFKPLTLSPHSNLVNFLKYWPIRLLTALVREIKELDFFIHYIPNWTVNSH